MSETKRKRVDMSSEALDRRLREVSQLYQLGVMLKTAKKKGKVKELRNNQQTHVN